MKTFVQHYRIDEVDSPQFNMYFNGMKPCIFDIETTGLSPATARIVMTAVMLPSDYGWTVTQFLAENHYEEHQVIIATIKLLQTESVDYLITYNGALFDVPFIKTRISKNNLPYSFEYYDLDLYRFIRNHTVLPLRLSSLSQMNIEQHLGIRQDRDDIITGSDNIRLFNEYSATGDTNIENIILTHNREDVVQLLRIFNILSADNFSDFLKTDSLHSAICSYGFPVLNGRFSVRTELKASKKLLRIYGDQIRDSFNALYFSGIERNYSAEFRQDSRYFEITIPLLSKDYSLYIDLQQIGLEGRFSELENCINDYLIISQGGELYSHTINALSEAIIERIISEEME